MIKTAKAEYYINLIFTDFLNEIVPDDVEHLKKAIRIALFSILNKPSMVILYEKQGPNFMKETPSKFTEVDAIIALCYDNPKETIRLFLLFLKSITTLYGKLYTGLILDLTSNRTDLHIDIKLALRAIVDDLKELPRKHLEKYHECLSNTLMYKMDKEIESMLEEML